VARRLGFRLIDEDILTRAAVEAGVDHEVVADVERRKSALVRLIEGFGSAGMAAGYTATPASAAGQPASEDLRGLIRSVIEDTATHGSTVILAHAASLALAPRDDVLRVLLAASPQTRAQRVAGTLGIEEREAALAVKRSDVARADYIKRFYGINAELPTHYDLVINTDRIAVEKAARLIVEATRGRADAKTSAVGLGESGAPEQRPRAGAAAGR
jgi:hypothetical protein